MNFKFHNIFFLYIIFLLSACGVKARPAFPPDKAIQNYLNHFLVDQEHQKVETKK